MIIVRLFFQNLIGNILRQYINKNKFIFILNKIYLIILNKYKLFFWCFKKN
jgi:hypothetical protein